MGRLDRIDSELRDRLTELSACIGKDTVAELVTMFVDGAPHQIQRLQRQLPGLPEPAAAWVHNLRGECAAIGAMRLASLCAELESAIAQGDDGGAGLLVDQLGGEFDRVVQALQSYGAAIPAPPHRAG